MQRGRKFVLERSEFNTVHLASYSFKEPLTIFLDLILKAETTNDTISWLCTIVIIFTDGRVKNLGYNIQLTLTQPTLLSPLYTQLCDDGCRSGKMNKPKIPWRYFG